MNTSRLTKETQQENIAVHTTLQDNDYPNMRLMHFLTAKKARLACSFLKSLPKYYTINQVYHSLLSKWVNGNPPGLGDILPDDHFSLHSIQIAPFDACLPATHTALLGPPCYLFNYLLRQNILNFYIPLV